MHRSLEFFFKGGAYDSKEARTTHVFRGVEEFEGVDYQRDNATGRDRYTAGYPPIEATGSCVVIEKPFKNRRMTMEVLIFGRRGRTGCDRGAG